MARVEIPVQMISSYDFKIEDITWTASDATNDHYINHPGKQPVFFLINNDGAGPVTFTVVSVASHRTFNRTGDVAIATTKDYQSICVIPDQGFDQGNGDVHIDTASPLISIAAISFAPNR